MRGDCCDLKSFRPHPGDIAGPLPKGEVAASRLSLRESCATFAERKATIGAKGNLCKISISLFPPLLDRFRSSDIQSFSALLSFPTPKNPAASTDSLPTAW